MTLRLALVAVALMGAALSAPTQPWIQDLAKMTELVPQHLSNAWTHTPDTKHTIYVPETTRLDKCHCKGCWDAFADQNHTQVDAEGCNNLCKSNPSCKFALFDKEFESSFHPDGAIIDTVPKCWLYNATRMPMTFAADPRPEYNGYTCFKKNYCELNNYVFVEAFSESFFSVSAEMGFTAYEEKNFTTMQALLEWAGNNSVKMGWQSGDTGTALLYHQNLQVTNTNAFPSTTDVIPQGPTCSAILANQYGSVTGGKTFFVLKSYLESSESTSPWRDTYAKASVETTTEQASQA